MDPITTTTYRLLDASIDPDGSGDLRILVNGESIKYITVNSGLYPSEDLCFGPALPDLLPSLPTGDWNTATISRDLSSGQPQFTAVQHDELPGIQHVWHPTRVDHLELQFKKKLRSNVHEVECNVAEQSVIAKLARFSWEIRILEAETKAYQWIE
ncbi:unnamed protein product [Clonostachys rosea]|uniref:Uncharacterized protein n=1 Tax=Bionectria ochroleuca TaxID=29856 RepID=A0ABY6U5S3_BIOOC|nr:unnamed protein product [Clonostachys rosea]